MATNLLPRFVAHCNIMMTAKIFVFHIWLTGTVTLLNSLTEFQELFDEIAMKLVEFF